MPISQIVTNSIANTAVTAAKLASDAFSPQIFKPSITSPANNATGILDAQLFTATTYLSLYGRSQANAQWEISTSSSFAFLNVSSTITGSNTQFQSNSSSGLTESKVHYIRVRYSDDANNSSEYSNTVQFTTGTFAIPVDFLVIAGGGAGGLYGGGGGAGGYRSSVGSSGGPSAAGSQLSLNASTNYPVTIGAGGSGVPGGVGTEPLYPQITSGSNSVFSSITSIGGGKGASAGSDTGATGGSGGGATYSGSSGTPGGFPKSGTPGQGNAGGTGVYGPSPPGANIYLGGGGGGAGSVGGNADASPAVARAGTGGSGIDSSITGSPVLRGGGGGGGAASGGPSYGPSSGGNPGPGGGGAGGAGLNNGGPGSTNTGGGGGGAAVTNAPGAFVYGAPGNGGSGTVILRYPNIRTISNPGGGLTLSSSPSGSNTVTTITAGTGNVSWS
jgi:hypothetical protein